MKYINNRFKIKNSSYINFDEIIDIDGAINFNLPGYKNEIVMNIILADFTEERKYNLVAKSEEGYISLFRHDDGFIGKISYQDKNYSIFPIKKKGCILIEHDLEKENSSSKPLACGVISEDKHHPSEKEDERTTIVCAGDCGFAFLDVLTIVTPPAEVWLNNNWGAWRDLWLMQSLSVSDAFIMSGINNKWVRNYWIYSASPITLSTDPQQDMNILSTSNAAQGIRNYAKSDVLNLLTNQGYFIGGGQVFGIASNINPGLTNKYTICEIPFIDGSRHTFAHEIGHTVGCDHSINIQAGSTCNRGLNFFVNGAPRGTIMADNVANNTRIFNFSNPAINFNGVPTGAADRNNAGVIRNHLCEFASINTQTTFSSSINNGSYCMGIPNIINASVTQTMVNGEASCYGPYTFQWSRATSSSGPWTSISGNGSSVTAPRIFGCTGIYIKVDVTSADGCNLTTIKYLPCANCIQQEIIAEERSSKPVEDINIHPNPSNGIIEIETIKDVVDLMIYNIEGQRKFNKHFDRGTKTISLDLSEYKNGIYLIKTQSITGEIFSKKLILMNE